MIQDKLPLKFNNLQTIFHFADLHIRNVKRHREYREVFQRLYDEIKKDTENAIAVVVGDIVHAKLEMSPELVDLTFEFLKSMANIIPTIVVAGNHDCYTPEHEILTGSGWVCIGDYVDKNLNDEVASFCDGQIIFEIPLAKIKKRYTGNLYHFVGKESDMMVTPTHEILYQFCNHPDKYYKKKAHEIDNVLIPISSQPKEYDVNYYAQLLGFSFAEGTFVNKNSKTNNNFCIRFHLKQNREINFLSNILNQLKYKFNINPQKNDSFYIRIFSTLAKDIFYYFDGKKEISWKLLYENKSFIYNFIIGYLNGDGSKNKNFWRFSSINKQSIEVLIVAARFVGMISHDKTDKEVYGRYENSKRQYLGNLCINNKINRTGITKKDIVYYDGMVYCLNVPSSNLLIRRNKKIFISGNCNLANPHRMDVISPIVKNINSENLFYLKNSGIYEVADTKLVVMSVFQDPSQYLKANEIEGKTKIALYHGIVHNAISETGYRFHNDKVNQKIFENFDIVLLGDVHKKQIISKYEVKEKIISENELQKYIDEGWEVIEEIC